MDSRLEAVLLELRASKFADLAGARLAATFPIAQRLVNGIIAATLPPGLAVGEVTIEARPDNRLHLRVRLARPAFLPPLAVPLDIERQPVLPGDPVLVLRLGAGAAGAIAGTVLRLVSALPPGVTARDRRIFVDIAALLVQQGQGDLLDCLEHLEITTGAGVILVAIRARVP